MGRGINRLSPARVRSVKRKGMYPDGAGLYLRVTEGPRGPTKSWLFRYGINGREHYCGLGALHTIGLAEARDKAKECRQIILDGGDPIAARKARRSAQQLASAKALTFEQCATAYISDHSAKWRSVKSGAQWRQSLRDYAYPVIGKLLVRDVDTAAVLRVIEPIWRSKTETASRLRGRVESILGWAAVRGYRSIDSENPARWKGHLQQALPARAQIAPTESFLSLHYSKIAAFLAVLRKDSSVAARALEFQIHTGTRPGKEICHARWSEVNFNERVWTIPAPRTKANREQRIPLCDRAMKILADMRQLGGAFIFPGGKSLQGSLGANALQDVVMSLGYGAVASAHGMRATFRTWAAEKTNFQREVCEAALGHATGDKTEAAYQRGDLFEKRRKLMDGWADFCAGKQRATALRAVP
jgi:integrase